MRFRVTPDALAASLSDGVVLLQLYTKKYFSLNETGSRVWTLLQEHATVSEIIDRLVEEFEVEPAEADRAVRELIVDLLSEQLIEPDAT